MEIGGRFNVEDRIDPQHPIREIRRQCDLALQALSEHFDEIGRRPRPPVDPAGTVAEGESAAGALLGALGPDVL